MKRLFALMAVCAALVISPQAGAQKRAGKTGDAVPAGNTAARTPARTLRTDPVKARQGALVDAVALYDDARYREAALAFKAILDADPSNDAAHYYSGLCATFLGKPAEAVGHLREAVRLDSSNYWYRDRLARLYVAVSEPDMAIDLYESLIRDFPKNTDIYYTLVQLYMQQGDEERILSTLDEIEAVAGKDEMVTLTRYDVLMRKQKYEDAYAVLENFNSEFSSPRILAAMGDYNIAHFRDTLALENYTEALSYDASNPQALLGVSEVYRFRSDYPNYFASVNSFITSESAPPESKARYLESLFRHTDQQFLRNFKPNLDLLVENFLESAPADSLTVMTVVPYYYSTGNTERALSVVEDCCKANPGSISSRTIYVQLLSALGQWERLVSESEQAYGDFPSETGFLEMKTVAEYQLKDYDGLLRDSERIIAAAPRDTASVLRALSGIGDVYHLKGESRKAYAAYEKALKLDPANCPVLNNYAYYLSVEGRKLRKAYNMSKITVEKEPDNPTYLDTFGWILFLQGKALEAKPFFKHAMLYGGKDSAVILDHYAEVLYALGEYDTARVYWNLAKAKNTDGSIPDLDERVARKLSKAGK